MKRKLLLSAGFIAVIFFACRKELKQADDATSNPDNFKLESRHYFYNIVRKQADPDIAVNNLSVNSKQRGSTSLYGNKNKIYPYWQYAYTSKTDKYDFVELPFTSKSKFATIIRINDPKTTSANISQPILQNSLNRLILYKNKAGQIKERLVTYIPDKEYLKNHSDISQNQINKLDKDFKGYIEYKNINGKFLFALKIVNGKAVKKFRRAENAMNGAVNATSQLQTNGTKLKTNTETCEIPYVEHWEQDCLPEDDPDNPGQVTENCGDWYLAGIEYGDPICTDDGNDDPGSDPDPCLDPANFNTAECGGDGGGDDPCPTCNPPPPNDPCGQGKSLSSNSSFKNKMTALKTDISKSYETAFKFNANGTIDSLTGGASGINFNFDSLYFANTTGFIHNHENNPDNISIFSADDFRTMYLAVSATSSQNRANYTFGLVTGQGSTYLLAINDLSAFNTFVDHTFAPDNPGQLAGFNTLYNFFINKNNSVEQNESGMLNLLSGLANAGNNTGLTLMKGDPSSFNGWKTVTKNPDGTLNYANCN